MASDDIFSFINDLYDDLPEADRLRFGELWTAYEQSYGDIWTKLLDSKLANNINFIPLYNAKRWLQHTFDDTTAVNLTASFQGNQDLSKGINLSSRYLIKFDVDGGAQHEVDLRGTVPSSTQAFEIVEKINLAAGFQFASLVVLNSLLSLTSPSSGSMSTITFYPASDPLTDASSIILGLDPQNLPITLPQYPYAYQLLDPLIVSIPSLQDKIHDDQIQYLLHEGTDYTVQFGTGIISFAAQPPADLFWAKNSFVNYETPYNNFGYLIDYYDTNSANYLKAVKGLWYAFWTGPRPSNIRSSLYLIFGLPAASEAGTVTGLTSTSITLTYLDNTQEVFQIPTDLTAEVSLNQSVTRFQPLVSGIVVLDKINSPGFLAREVGRVGVQQFLTEKASRGEGPDTDETKALTLLEENTYLPQIDVNAFINLSIKLGNVKKFLSNIQPKSRAFLFQVLVGNFEEPLAFNETFGEDVNLSVNSNLDSNQTIYGSDADRLDAETNPLTGIIFDEDILRIDDDIEIMVSHNDVPIFFAGETLEPGMLTYIDPVSGSAHAALADTLSHCNGFLYAVIDTELDGVHMSDAGFQQTLLLQSGDSFIAGGSLYLSVSEKGKLTTTPPSGTGNVVFLMGQMGAVSPEWEFHQDRSVQND